jgi:hypothetical protein
MKKATFIMLLVYTLTALTLGSCVIGQSAEQGKANGLSHEQKHAISKRNAKDGCNQHVGYVGY